MYVPLLQEYFYALIPAEQWCVTSAAVVLIQVFYLVASLSAHISDQQVLRREPRQGPDKAAHSVRAHLVEANQRSSLRFMKELHQGSQTTTLTAGGIQDDPELTLCFSLERHNGNKDKSKPQSEVMWRHSSSWSHLDPSYSAHDTV